MNPLQKLNRLLQYNRSNWNAEVRRLIKDIPDYQDIEKVEYGMCEKARLWYVYVNGVPYGEPFLDKELAKHTANWLHDNRHNFNLVITRCT